jgi:hypothetical protein
MKIMNDIEYNLNSISSDWIQPRLQKSLYVMENNILQK